MKIEIWVSPEDAHWWMTDKNQAHVYQMSFAYRETPTYSKKVVLNMNPEAGDGIIVEQSARIITKAIAGTL